MAVDRQKVVELSDAMLDGAAHVADYSVNELVSGVLTTAQRIIQAVLETSPAVAPGIAKAVGELWMECVDPTKKPN